MEPNFTRELSDAQIEQNRIEQWRKRMASPKTIEDFAVSTFVDKAKIHDNYLLFWADLLNYASGNVAGIISIFEWAGVSTKDIEEAYNQLRKL